MYETIKDRLLAYIAENRPDLHSEFNLAADKKAFIAQLMNGTKPNIKFLLSQGINRNKIQWICLNELLDSIANPKILLAKSQGTAKSFNSMLGTKTLTAEMVELMGICSQSLTKSSPAAIALN